MPRRTVAAIGAGGAVLTCCSRLGCEGAIGLDVEAGARRVTLRTRLEDQAGAHVPMRLLFAVLLLAGILACGLVVYARLSNENIASTPLGPITRERAEEIARKASRDLIPSEARAVIAETRNEFIVTFPTNLPPGVAGGDFYARVTIDKITGRVIKKETSA